MRSNCRSEHGAVSVEYVGVGVALIVLVTALALSGVGGSISKSFGYVFCTAASVVDGRSCEKPISEATDTRSPKEIAESGDYVALGDSYSSGEGADDYVDNTNSDDATKKAINDLPIDLWPGEPHNNICRRSANAYSATVYQQGDFEGDYIFGACSGGIASDYYENNHSGNDDEGPQRDLITEDTSLITISMGGNDFGFANTVAACVQRGLGLGGACGTEEDSVTTKAAIDDKLDELVQLYQDLENDAPDDARIVIVGYPRLFPEDPTGPTWGIAERDQPWINDMGTYANRALQRAIAESGTDVEFVDVTEALSGHESGTAEPWLHDLEFGVDGGNWHKPVSNNSYHPTAEGQNAIAAIVQQQIEEGP